MSIIQKAIKCNKQNSVSNGLADLKDKKLVSGCYGIDNLFTNKSKKLSFKEFWAGIKDIFLAILIFIPKTISTIFGFIKRPGYALSIFFALAITGVILLFHDDEPVGEKNVPAVQNAKFLTLNNDNLTDTHTIATANSVDVNSGFIPSVITNSKDKKLRFSRTFETKVNNFFCKHKISDIMCKDGNCRLKIGESVFCEHSALCEYPKIILESATEDEIVFSDGVGSYCTVKIDRLFQ